jgi:signal transduction histidine kinase
LLQCELLAAVEQERQRLGRELHDGLSQLLTGVKLKVGLLQRQLARSRTIEPSEMESVEQEINQAIQQAQAMARGLNPVELVAQGLEAALAELAAGVRATFNLPCKCECHLPAGLDNPETARHLYRIAQEAVHNAVKHARAGSVRIELTARRDRLVLEVHDDGVGFSPRPDLGKGMGLPNMKTRAQLIGGVLRIQAARHGGTVVRCTVPQSALSPAQQPAPRPEGSL